MTTGGLGASDVGRPWTVGGIALEFYRNIFDYYKNPAVWNIETRDEYLPKHRLIYNEGMQAQWFFEPHVAERVLRSMLEAADVPVIKEARLDRENGVVMDGQRIKTIRTEDGRSFSGKMFIDATYEGDLMAAAGVSYAVGRESNAQYGETFNGIRFLPPHRAAHVDPYVVPGDPSSGLLPRILPAAPGKEGDGDHRIQAYNFRLCLTNDPDNRVAVTKPDDYNPLEYETVLRHLQGNPTAKLGDFLFTLTPMPNLKTDSNNKNLFSTDYPGMNYDWAEASYAEREKIWQQHKTYNQGLLWFLANDERVPASIQAEVSEWGLAKDEFTDTDNWPHQLYVRQARRMVGEYVVTEADCRGQRRVDDGVTLASYEMDSHLVSLFVDEEGRLRLEGAFFHTVSPYPVSYRALLPQRGECENLLVPVCVSASHAAYGSMRMEPVFMMLAQAAATAAALAIQTDTPLHDLPVSELRQQLIAEDMVLGNPNEMATADNPDDSAALEEAIKKLTDLGIIQDPEYWLTNARAGRLCDLDHVDHLVLAGARQFADVDSVEQAIDMLASNGVIRSPDYWRSSEHTSRGGVRGNIVAHFITSLAKVL